MDEVYLGIIHRTWRSDEVITLDNKSHRQYQCKALMVCSIHDDTPYRNHDV